MRLLKDPVGIIHHFRLSTILVVCAITPPWGFEKLGSEVRRKEALSYSAGLAEILVGLGFF